MRAERARRDAEIPGANAPPDTIMVAASRFPMRRTCSNVPLLGHHASDGFRMSVSSPASRVLITSALPYINGVKHLGTLAGSQLPADVFGRFQRARGQETLLICATDEHGSTTELAASEAGQDGRTLCARAYRFQKDAGGGVQLSLEQFRRSVHPPKHE